MTDVVALTTGMLTVIGALAFVVSVVTEVLKELPGSEHVPPELVVIGLSIASAVVTFFGYSDYVGHSVVWYEVIGAVIGGFIVAFVAMFGWETFHDMWKRLGKGKGGE